MNRLRGDIRIHLLIIFAALLFAALALGLGVYEATGLTGKDEYALGLRIPLEMIERNDWWIPFSDGEPRLRKPPFLYWIARFCYENFGASLLTARLITVSFALLLLSSTAWLGKRLSGDWTTGLIAAGILLGFGGIATESRRLMLDVPVAALSTAAFCVYLSWAERPRWSALILSAALLSAALMTKGPVGLVACGSGFIAVWLVRPEGVLTAPIFQLPNLRRLIKNYWFSHLLFWSLVIVLPALWYWDVTHHYAAQFAAITQDEIEARGSSGPSLDPLVGMLELSLPWFFVGLAGLVRQRRERDVKFLLVWLIISLLPFFFIRSFSRYLIGSLPAFALIAAYGLTHGPIGKWATRLGSIVPMVLVGTLTALLWRWGHPISAVIVALALLVFVWNWWLPEMRNRRGYQQLEPAGLILSAILLSAVSWGIGFPRLGVNALPEQALSLAQSSLARGKQVFMFDGPQPALLPMLSGRALRHIGKLNDVADKLSPGTLITVRLEDLPRLQNELTALNHTAKEIYRYQSLTSSGSGVKFQKAGATKADWQQAWREASPAPLMSTVIYYEVQS